MTKRVTVRTILAAAALLAASAAAQAGNQSRFKAFAVGDGQFEVIAAFSENAIYWCGAATFARQNLSPAGTDKLYVLSGPAPSTARLGETAVRFGIVPPAGGAAGPAFSTDVSIIGNSMSVSQANQTCNERTASG